MLPPIIVNIIASDPLNYVPGYCLCFLLFKRKGTEKMCRAITKFIGRVSLRSGSRSAMRLHVAKPDKATGVLCSAIWNH